MIVYVGTRCTIDETPYLHNRTVRHSFASTPALARELYARYSVGHFDGPIYVAPRIRAQNVQLERVP